MADPAHRDVSVYAWPQFDVDFHTEICPGENLVVLGPAGEGGSAASQWIKARESDAVELQVVR